MKKVAIAILCNSMSFLKWQADIIRAVRRHECCEVRGFIIAENVQLPIAEPLLDWSRISWKVACAIEALLYPRRGIAANQHIDIANEFAQTPILLLPTKPEKSPFENRPRQADIKTCRELHCDILINFGLGELHEDILGVARMGIWSYHHADTRVNKGMPPGFWEFYYDDPVTGVTLGSADLGGGKVLARGFYKTNRYSWTRNAESIYSKGSHLLMDKIVELCTVGDIRTVSEEFSHIYAGRCSTSPSVVQCVVAITKFVRRSAALLLYELVFRDVWELIISKA